MDPVNAQGTLIVKRQTVSVVGISVKFIVIKFTNRGVRPDYDVALCKNLSGQVYPLSQIHPGGFG